MTPQFELFQWWSDNHPLPQGQFEAVKGRDLAVIARYLKNGGTEDEFQKLAVYGWGVEDPRTAHFCRISIPCFVKEIPHLRQTFQPSQAWAPPKDVQASQYAKGKGMMDALLSHVGKKEQPTKPVQPALMDRARFFGVKK